MKKFTEVTEVKEEVNETLLKMIKDAEWEVEYHRRKLKEQKEILEILKTK